VLTYQLYFQHKSKVVMRIRHEAGNFIRKLASK
jgi:hypothetical protein